MQYILTQEELDALKAREKAATSEGIALLRKIATEEVQRALSLPPSRWSHVYENPREQVYRAVRSVLVEIEKRILGPESGKPAA